MQQKSKRAKSSHRDRCYTCTFYLYERVSEMHRKATRPNLTLHDILSSKFLSKNQNLLVLSSTNLRRWGGSNYAHHRASFSETKIVFWKENSNKKQNIQEVILLQKHSIHICSFFSHVAAVIGQQVSLPLLLLSLPSTLLIYLFGKLVLGKLDFVLAIIFDSMNK